MKRFITVTAVIAIFLAIPSLAMAHPLGNFSINRYAGIEVTPEAVVVDYVIDAAEIPTQQRERDIDTDGDGVFSTDELEAYTASSCATSASGFDASLSGRALDVAVLSSGPIVFPEGQAGLPTTRLECKFVVDLPSSVGRLVIDDTNDPNAVGWREMTVNASGISLSTDAPESTITGRLLNYPEDALVSSPERRSVTVELSGPTGESYAAVSADVSAAPVSATGRPVDAFASLITRADLGPTGLIIALLAALGLGIAHALAPGHGKTVMAAFLVGRRGTARHALVLGLAVAVSHTIGVFALGLVTVVASSAFRPERVYPILSTLSGFIVLGVGVWLLIRVALGRGHHHGHTHGPGDHHDHDHGAGHHHHHELPDDDTPLGWKSLAALGLSGGLVPSASAVVLLLGAIQLGRIELGLVLIAAFGVGMSLALVGVGLALVVATRFGMDLLPEGGRLERFSRYVPALVALVVVGIGAWLTITNFTSALG